MKQAVTRALIADSELGNGQTLSDYNIQKDYGHVVRGSREALVIVSSDCQLLEHHIPLGLRHPEVHNDCLGDGGLGPLVHIHLDGGLEEFE